MEKFELADFYEVVAPDPRIGNSHICLYLALVNETNLNIDGFYPINRSDVMKNAKISRKTYHKCLKELCEYGYIKYEPTDNAYSRSKVLLRRL